MDSILTTIKTMLGLSSDNTDFDNELVVDINVAFAMLYQVGVSSAKVLTITGADEKWTDFFTDPYLISLITNYTHQRVKLLFDPPTNSFLVDKTKELLSQLEWLIYINVNQYYPDEEDD